MNDVSHQYSFKGQSGMTSITRLGRPGHATRLNQQELLLRDRLEAMPEFAMAGYATGEMRTFRGLVVRRGGAVRGIWTYADGLYRWVAINSGCDAYATPHIERAARQTMLMVLNSLMVRRAVRQSGATDYYLPPVDVA